MRPSDPGSFETHMKWIQKNSQKSKLRITTCVSHKVLLCVRFESTTLGAEESVATV